MKELLYDALASEYGIAVTCKSADRLRAKLYPLRKTDPDLLILSFVLSPDNPETELWIIKKARPNGKTEE